MNAINVIHAAITELKTKVTIRLIKAITALI
jgi:hypothetical protein